MSRFRFVHAADLHLDTPFEGIGRTAPQVADVLRDASLEAWDALVRLAIEQDASFLLIAGDIYDGAARGVRAQLRFCRGLERLSEHGIGVFIVHGNHDPLDGWSAIRQWPDGTTVFGSECVQAIPFERDGTRLATIHGISYARREVFDNLARQFVRGPDPGLHIGLLHCNVGGHPEHAPYSPCSFEDLIRAGMDYWALGHVHRYQANQEDRQTIVYPGCLQGRSAHACDEGPKGAVVVEAEDDRVRSMEFVPVDRIRYVSTDVDISDVEDIRALQELLLRRATEVRAAQRPAGVLIKAVLSGRTDVHRDLGRPGVLPELLKTMREETAGFDPLFWWIAINDRSRLTADLDTISRRGDFSAELLRCSQQCELDAGRLTGVITAQQEALARVSLPGVIRDELDAADPFLLRDATRLALDLLEEE
jgi:DNA repair exonuclease SbcCD nuclease subunit